MLIYSLLIAVAVMAAAYTVYLPLSLLLRPIFETTKKDAAEPLNHTTSADGRVYRGTATGALWQPRD
jgi:hypothetical protein